MIFLRHKLEPKLALAIKIKNMKGGKQKSKTKLSKGESTF